MKKLITVTLLAAMLLVCLSATALAASSVYFSGSCHVRTGPGTGYDSIGIVNKGSYLPYKGYSQYGSDGYTWYNVNFNGQDGWVSAKYGSLSDSSGITTYGAGGYGGSSDGSYTGSFTYGSGVYITGKCNVRSGPSLSHNSIGTAYKGDVLTGTGNISTDSRGIAWYSVTYKGNPGWVSSVYASITGGTSYSAPSYSSGGSSSYSAPSYSSSGTVRGVTGDSFVRTGPGLSYSKLGVLYQGSSATYLGESSVDNRGVVWYKISWNGSSGWVSSRYTSLY